jgi:hypothetical protein
LGLPTTSQAPVHEPTAAVRGAVAVFATTSSGATPHEAAPNASKPTEINVVCAFIVILMASLLTGP